MDDIADFLKKRNGTGLAATLRMQITVAREGYVEAIMPISPKIAQFAGFVHGGATLALIESAASAGAAIMTDLEKNYVFGTRVDVRHKKSGVTGFVRAVATLDGEEPNLGKAGGTKQVWNVRAYDDAGDVISEGTFTTKTIPRESAPQNDYA